MARERRAGLFRAVSANAPQLKWRGCARELEELRTDRAEGQGHVAKNDALEIRNEVGQKAIQTEDGLGSVEALQTESVAVEVVLELFDAVLAVASPVVETPDIESRGRERRHDGLVLPIDHLEQHA